MITPPPLDQKYDYWSSNDFADFYITFVSGNAMLVRHYSTNVSGSFYPGNDLAVPPSSEINKSVDQDTGTWPEFTSCEDTFSDKGESLYLNFTETVDAIIIEAELSGFGTDEVVVSFQKKTLIMEACRCEELNKS